MTKRSPEERERLGAALRQSSREDRRDEAGRAKGLDRLLEAEAALPPRGRKGTAGKLATAVVVVALLAAWWLRPTEPSPDVPRVVLPPPLAVVVDAGAPPALVELVQPTEPEPESPRPKVKPVAPRAVADDPDLLERELALLDRARQELRTSPERALTILETWRRDFPRGALAVEASLVRVEALLALGRRAEGEELARKLIAADVEGDGLVTRRLGRLLDGGVSGR